MKKLALLATLVFSVMFSSASFAGWTKVSQNVDGVSFYVDFERIRKHGGYVYYWFLTDYLKPNPEGDLSDKTYSEGDCDKFRSKWLSLHWHKGPRGTGPVAVTKPSVKNSGWKYPSPNS